MVYIFVEAVILHYSNFFFHI